MTDCPIPTVQPEETLAPLDCTAPKDSTVSSIPYQTWQVHSTPTTPEPPDNSTNTNAQPQPQAVQDTGLEVSFPQYTKAIEPSFHESPITTNQTLGFRNLFCQTPMQVGLKPTTDPPARCPPNQDTKPPYTSKPNKNTQSLKSSASPISAPLKTTITPIPHTNPSTTQPWLKSSIQPPLVTHSPKPKRRNIEEEIANFAKRPRKAANGPEPVFFDPDTVSLIPQSRSQSPWTGWISCYFLKQLWPTVGDDVIKAVTSFFRIGSMPREVDCRKPGHCPRNIPQLQSL
ncbi:hypothetical protein CMV_010966 [Castanea mollissima]|uniref:Uncharacterized protein n=1 Tax=Castanea mollissima TaxID=60419 RepID=A0A8J4VLA8_9ROSI|nr:hypothetical protein CMV_010966 [Castanea mollissima]